MSKTSPLDFDPLRDDTKQPNIIHIRVQQRSGRKALTTIQGIPAEYDVAGILKAFRKILACNGSITDDENYGKVIQLQGDHRVKISEMLIEEGIAKRDEVKIHGF